jgi:hypothetical protein
LEVLGRRWEDCVKMVGWMWPVFTDPGQRAVTGPFVQGTKSFG